MISDKDLRDAARAYEKAVLDSLPEPEDRACSPAFERRMKKLILRVDHPVLYWLSRLLPVLVAGLILAAALLARGCGPERPAPPEAAIIYRPTWLPEGCEPDREALYGTEGMIVYRTEDGREAVFLYTTDSGAQLGAGLENGKEVLVNRWPGLFYLWESKGDLSDLFWTDGDAGVSFWLSAPFGEREMLRVAESVEARPAE